MDFKKGDWIRDIVNNTIVQYTGQAYHKGGVEPWQPQEGEWCWFHISDKRIPIFERYGGNFYHWANDDNEIISIEPFIGELPSFIKDK